jgi:hypothetical protein
MLMTRDLDTIIDQLYREASRHVQAADILTPADWIAHMAASYTLHSVARALAPLAEREPAK